MRRIFIVQCSNDTVYHDFVKSVTKGIINVMSYSYYEDILNPIRKALNIKSDVNKYKELQDIENYWFHRSRRQSLIDLLINNILDRDGNRTVLFLHLNNKVIANRLKRAFPKVCKTVILIDPYIESNILNGKVELLSSSDILIKLPPKHEVKIKSKIIDNFRVSHIPIKYFVE